MPAPAIRALFTACFIANGDCMVVVGIVLLLTGGADDKTSAENMGGESYAVVLDE